MLQPYRKGLTRIILRKSNEQVHKQVDVSHKPFVWVAALGKSRAVNSPWMIPRSNIDLIKYIYF